MMSRLAGTSSIGAALILLVAAAPAFAAETVVVTPSVTTATAPLEPAGTLPNRFLLRSGVFTLSAAYVPSLVVAIESDREADNHLYAPIVGPWFDLAARGNCRGDCSAES